MFSKEELDKIKSALTDFGDIVWNDMDDHSPQTVRNLDEAIALIDKAYLKSKEVA